MVHQVRQLGDGAVQLSAVTTASPLGLTILVLLGGIAAGHYSCPKIVLLMEIASLGIMTGAEFFYLTYSVLLPRMLPARELLAANGTEGITRPEVRRSRCPVSQSASSR